MPYRQTIIQSVALSKKKWGNSNTNIIHLVILYQISRFRVPSKSLNQAKRVTTAGWLADGGIGINTESPKTSKGKQGAHSLRSFNLRLLILKRSNGVQTKVIKVTNNILIIILTP